MKMMNFDLIITLTGFFFPVHLNSLEAVTRQVHDPELTDKQFSTDEAEYLKPVPLLGEVITNSSEIEIIPSEIVINPYYANEEKTTQSTTNTDVQTMLKASNIDETVTSSGRMYGTTKNTVNSTTSASTTETNYIVISTKANSSTPKINNVFSYNNQSVRNLSKGDEDLEPDPVERNRSGDGGSLQLQNEWIEGWVLRGEGQNNESEQTDINDHERLHSSDLNRTIVNGHREAVREPTTTRPMSETTTKSIYNKARALIATEKSNPTSKSVATTTMSSQNTKAEPKPEDPLEEKSGLTVELNPCFEASRPVHGHGGCGEEEITVRPTITIRVEEETSPRTAPDHKSRTTDPFPVPGKCPGESSKRYPDKASCSRDGHICICDAREFLKALKNAAFNGRANLASLECCSYAPIDGAKAELSDGPKRAPHTAQLEPDGNEGPKELPLQNIKDLVDCQDQDGYYFVFRDRDITMSCSADDLPPGKYRYIWSKSRKRGDLTSASEDRMSVNVDDGSLTLSGAQFEDRGVYLCVAVDDDNKEIKFSHNLYVVALPRLTLQRTSDYLVLKKYDAELTAGHENLMREIENLICSGKRNSKICRIETYRHIKEISLVSQLRLVGLEKILRKQSDNCGPECHLTIMYKLLDALEKNWRTAIDAFSMLKEDSTILAVHPLRVLEIRTIISCDAGYELFQMFCVPCCHGMYSTEGQTVCKICPFGTYQDEMGATSCKSMVTRVCVLFSLALTVTVLSLICILMQCHKMKSRSKIKKRNRVYE